MAGKRKYPREETLLEMNKEQEQCLGTPLVGQWLRPHTPSAEGLSWIPDQGTRSHMPQLRVHTLQLRPGATK